MFGVSRAVAAPLALVKVSALRSNDYHGYSASWRRLHLCAQSNTIARVPPETADFLAYTIDPNVITSLVLYLRVSTFTPGLTCVGADTGKQLR